MNILDILLLAAGGSAGIFSFLSGNNALHKLFLGLIIGFLMYALVSAQVDLVNVLSPSQYNSYQIFLSKNTTGVLSLMLIVVPLLGLLFMLSSKLHIETAPKSPSHLLLGLLLPIFLIGILSFLGDGSLLSENPTWNRVFSFFESSSIYRIFQTLPWAIFALLTFLVFYKTLFTICINFFIWLWHDVLLQFFKSWKEKRQKNSSSDGEQENYDEDE